jgi:protein SCO1/2
MAERSASPPRATDRAWALLGGIVLVAIGLVMVAVVLLVTVGRGWVPTGGPSGGFLYPEVRDAPPIELTDQDGHPFSLAALRGSRVLVFFGYTHCPDVCPATVGTVGKVLAAAGPSTRAVFVTVDPERDTPAWLADYVRYIPKGFTAATGSLTGVRSVADAWGVRYAKVDTGTPGAYSMTHTADVYLVDARGRLRAHFPFGTTSDEMLSVVRTVPAWSAAAAEPSMPAASPALPAASAPTTAPSAASAAVPGGTAPLATAAAGSAVPSTPTSGRLTPVIVSTSIWAGGASPVMVTLFRDGVPIADPAATATFQVVGADGAAVGPPVAAVTVQPPGVPEIWFVGTLDIPTPGLWTLSVTTSAGGSEVVGSVGMVAEDQGATPPLGGPAPDVRTPTLADVGGDPKLVTTDPAPDLRLSRTSTADARAAGTPYVLVVDSYRFKVTPVCGKALLMARYLADRWPDVAFIHLEPYQYSVVTDSFVLGGVLSDPPVSAVAAAWGLGTEPWTGRSMPWVFVVDGTGTVVAKYQGVVGSADIDVILTMLGRTPPG